jgi:hypothetical protein
VTTPLTAARIAVDYGDDRALKDYSGPQTPDRVAILFRDLEGHLCDLIRRYVVGCVAWLTNETILAALSEVRHGVSLVVQKEDFLRPDINPRDGWRKRLRALYDDLPCGPERCWHHNALVASLSCACDPVIDAVRCVGNHNRSRSPAFPRMHNKFLVFCNLTEGKTDEQFPDTTVPTIVPQSVWTGSFNLTKNATMSFENAVLLVGNSVAGAYFNEWAQILALSEPLDWRSEWMEPEWRVGT